MEVFLANGQMMVAFTFLFLSSAAALVMLHSRLVHFSFVRGFWF